MLRKRKTQKKLNKVASIGSRVLSEKENTNREDNSNIYQLLVEVS